MDVRAMAGWDNDYDYIQEGVSAVGFKGNAKEDSKEKTN